MKKMILLLVFIGIFIYPILYINSIEVIEISINNKERVTTGSGENMSSKYLIYAENEVLENTDAFIFFKFNSSDVYNELKLKEVYKVKVAGWRIPFLSSYRNIIKVVE